MKKFWIVFISVFIVSLGASLLLSQGIKFHTAVKWNLFAHNHKSDFEAMGNLVVQVLGVQEGLKGYKTGVISMVLVVNLNQAIKTAEKLEKHPPDFKKIAQDLKDIRKELQGGNRWENETRGGVIGR